MRHEENQHGGGLGGKKSVSGGGVAVREGVKGSSGRTVDRRIFWAGEATKRDLLFEGGHIKNRGCVVLLAAECRIHSLKRTGHNELQPAKITFKRIS